MRMGGAHFGQKTGQARTQSAVNAVDHSIHSDRIPSAIMNTSLRCDIFCTVVDNFGDAAVCWRLASQLADDFGWQVRLWIDDPQPLYRLAPDAPRSSVDVRRWEKSFADTAPADIVIETFACELPPNYVAAMASRTTQPVWLNLEYLSAEDWVSGCHGLPSPHPRLPLTKHFFFPGFDSNTGGLLRERDYEKRRRVFNAKAFRQEFLLGDPPPASLTISLFSYVNPALPALLAAWARSDTPIQVLCPGSTEPRQQIGRLELVPLPFLPQQRYDELLWTCDLNFVRGEDSFIRAQWAAKPLVWQIYPQTENLHLQKLDAFIAAFGKVDAGHTLSIRTMAAFWHAWNGDGTLDWPAFSSALPAMRQHTQIWTNHLAAHTDLATNLVQFCLARLK